jgi:hypothetical protein
MHVFGTACGTVSILKQKSVLSVALFFELLALPREQRAVIILENVNRTLLQ